jgi:hypothetical protein
MKKSYLIALFIILAFDSKAQAVISDVDSIAGMFVKAIRKDKSEQIIVQTNKWYYSAGEDLWLKAWVVNKVSHKYYAHSQNLYVDIVDERDTAIAQLLLNIPSEKTEGFIRLSDSIPEGHYWLRAYTSSMLQNDKNAMFVKPLYIINPKHTSKLSVTNTPKSEKIITQSKPIVSFYPEGGVVVTGVNVVFGIKSIDSLGKPMEVKGYITDNTDSSVVTWFNTSTNTGLGKFNFYVGKNKKYTAHVQLKNTTLYYELPLPDHKASQISIKQASAANLRVVVSQGDSLYKKGVSSYLLGMSRDSICFASVGNDMYEFSIPKMNFPNGEAKLLLFNDQKQITSERSIYITGGTSSVKVIASKPSYNAREKVPLDMFVGDSVFHPQFSALSVAVTDDSIVQEPLYEDGPIVSLSDTNADLNDLIMLTKQPEFLGKQVSAINAELKEDALAASQQIDYETIKGKVLNKKNIPVPNRVVTLYTNKKINLFDTDTTNANGQFRFKVPLHYDTIPFTLQVASLRGNVVDEKIAIDIHSDFPMVSTPEALKKKITPLQVNQVARFRSLKTDSAYVVRGKEWLKDVVVKTSIKSNSYNTTKRISNFSQVFTGEALQKMTGSDASNAMLMIPGLHLRAGFLTLGGVTSFTVSAKDEPLLIVDGMAVAGGNGPQMEADSGMHAESSPVLAELSKIPTDIIDFVEVLKGPEAAFYGTRSSNGVIIVNTHRVSNFRNHIESYGHIQYNSKSYHLAPNFTNPDYDNLFLKSTVLQDRRSTIYWNGHLYTNPNGKATISFFTSDRKSDYTVIITGVTVSGELIEKKVKIKRD